MKPGQDSSILLCGVELVHEAPDFSALGHSQIAGQFLCNGKLHLDTAYPLSTPTFQGFCSCSQFDIQGMEGINSCTRQRLVPGSSNHVKIPIKCYPDVLKPETFEMWEGTVGAWQQGDMVRAFGGERDRSWFRKAASQSSETRNRSSFSSVGLSRWLDQV